MLLLAVLLGLGSLLGSVRYKGVHLGPAAVLFGSVAVSSIGVANDVELAIPEIVGVLGLVLFTYSVGLMSGPNFFASLRRGWTAMLAVVGVFIVAAVIAVIGGRLLDLDMPVVAGTFAGALTNTPALAAAAEAAGTTSGPTIGYSIGYVYGVAGFLMAALLVLRRWGSGSRGDPLTNLTIRIDLPEPVCAHKIAEEFGDEVVFSRVQHGEDHPIEIIDEHEILRHDDLVTVVGPAGVLARVAERLGHRSSHALASERTDLDFRRITLSRPHLAGRTIEELDLEQRFGAVATRVRRGDRDMVAQEHFVVQMGDRIRVTAPVPRMGEVSAYLGDSERGLSDINPIGFALGLAVGVAIGLVHLPGTSFQLGAAAGTLLVGLVFGRLVRIGPLVVSMSTSSATSLSTFGMITFLAFAGSRAGRQFVGAITSDLGWKVLLLGIAVTSAAAIAIIVVGRFVLRCGGVRLAGMLGGAQTQPAVLAFANDRTGHDLQVGLGYALVFPAAMVAKILLAQILAGL